MTVLLTVSDLVGLLAFAAATVLVLVAPEPEGTRPDISKWLLAVVFGIYVFITASDATADLGVTNVLHPFEDYVEVLVPLFVLGFLLARRASQRLHDIAQARRALQRSHDLMLDIVDGAPAGILFLDAGGRVAFANEVAKTTLDLVEDGSLTSPGAPSWTLSWRGEAQEPGDLSSLVRPEPYDAERVTLNGRDGARAELRVSGRPLSVRSGGLGGAVVTFERT